jgi:hypothetical protein
MAAASDNDKVRDGQELAFLRMIRRLDPSKRPLLLRYMHRLNDGMPAMEAATRYYIELGWSDAEAREQAARIISANPRRWQDSLD